MHKLCSLSSQTLQPHVNTSLAAKFCLFNLILRVTYSINVALFFIVSNINANL
jgi:hypothetical protein